MSAELRPADMDHPTPVIPNQLSIKNLAKIAREAGDYAEYLRRLHELIEGTGLGPEKTERHR